MPPSALLAATAQAAGARARILVLLLVLSGCAASSARAHGITVDGNVTDWSPRVGPVTANLGHLARDSSGAGEYVWKDAAGDERTDVFSPDPQVDLTEFRITGTPAALSFLFRMTDLSSLSLPPQVQVAIDMDQVAGSGQSYFGGYSDTQVGPNARWEYLVSTRFATGGAPIVSDPAFQVIGTGSAALSTATDAIELQVPWTLLGLAGPPAHAIRFSVAIFRSLSNDLTQDVGGSAVSNALDAVTNYFDPRTSAYPNTWAEVGDGVLDYAFDVWFEPDGEPLAPLLLSEVMVAPTTSGEWIEIVNRTPVPLSLDGVKIGDEETPDGSERMAAFPVGGTIPAGGAVTAAAASASYATAYAKLPDYEWVAADPAVPDLTTYAKWSSIGSLSLSDAGDEVLLLDRWDTVLDVLPYGSGAYAGVRPYTPAPSAGYSLERTLVNHDTDDGQADFFHQPVPTPGVPASGITEVVPAFPTRIELGPTTPNPAVQGSSLTLALPRATRVRAQVVDVGGRRVRHLVDAEWSAGAHVIAWDLTDDERRRVAPGCYRVRVEAGDDRGTRTVVVLR